MGNEIATIEAQATAFSMLVSNPNTQAVLDRAFDCTATFTAADIALADQVAQGALEARPADDDYVRKSVASLSAAMPSQATNTDAGKLKLKTYQTMLIGSDERAIAYACRRCLAELDWFPTVHQIVERIRDWVSPEHAAIARARAILRSGRRARQDSDDATAVSSDDLRRVRERAEAAARASIGRRAEPVALDTPGELAPHQLKIPNKGDYERLFRIDPDVEAAKAAAILAQEQAYDADMLRQAYDQHLELYRAA